MRVRKLLQTEASRKRTTRKIFLRFGVFSGVVIVGYALWSIVERNWITPGERSAAREALTQLDDLQDSGYLSNGDFVARAQQTERTVDEAGRAARTKRDHMIAAELMKYRSATVANYDLVRRQVLAQQQNPSRKPDEGIKSFGVFGVGFDSRQLHKDLD